MKIKIVALSPILLLILSGCGIADLAKNAADATACKALSSTINGIATAYQSGLVDSGLISQIDTLVGEQARSLLSTGLAQDLSSLTEVLGQNQRTESSQEKIKILTDSISKRCADAGTVIGSSR